MIEYLIYLIMVPNLIAGYWQMIHKVHYSNLIYIPGYLLFIIYNYFFVHNFLQVVYFSILWYMSIKGVVHYKRSLNNYSKVIDWIS